ncbi:20220_t:CDS:2, partial [Dentiscutata erythropus]
FSLQLIVPRWIPKHQRLDAANEYIHFGQRFKEITNNDFVNKLLFYRKVWGLIHTAINKCMLYHDNEFVLLIKDYLNKIRDEKEELIRIQKNTTETSTSQNVIENTEVNTIQLENP